MHIKGDLDYRAFGTIITSKNKPAANVTVTAFSKELVKKEYLGRTNTDEDGYFSIEFDSSNFDDWFDPTDNVPNVYLVIEYDKGKTLRTQPVKTKKEIEFHIKLEQGGTYPYEVNLYADNMSKIFQDVMSSRNAEIINLGNLIQGNIPQQLKNQLQQRRQSMMDTEKTLNGLWAIFSGISHISLSAFHLDRVGYDGPQVPRNPRHEPYDKVIIWTRKD